MTDTHDTAHFLYRRHQFDGHSDAVCLSCTAAFPVAAMERWIDGGTTPICPRCGFDFVAPGTWSAEALARAHASIRELPEGMTPLQPGDWPRLTRAERRALVMALADAVPNDGTGPKAATWARLRLSGRIDGPAGACPNVTDAGLRALGLPAAVSGPQEALRAAVRHLLPWRRPAVRLGALDVTLDDPDDEAADPIAVGAHPDVIGGVSAAYEDAYEAQGGCADTVWDAVYAWTERVGFPLDTTLRGGWRIVWWER